MSVNEGYLVLWASLWCHCGALGCHCGAVNRSGQSFSYAAIYVVVKLIGLIDDMVPE